MEYLKPSSDIDTFRDFKLLDFGNFKGEVKSSLEDLVLTAEVIKEDFQHLAEGAKKFSISFLCGLSMPLAYNTSFKKFNSQLLGVNGCLDYVASSLGVGLGLVSSGLLSIGAIQQGKGKHYLGVVIVANVVDYLYNTYKRASKGM